MAVLKLTLKWMAAVVVALSTGLAAPDEHAKTSMLRSRLRVQRAICSGGRLAEVDEVCRWPGLECACVSGTFCSSISNSCEVCQTSSADCTSPCQYTCRNGGVCVWETGRCQCPPEYWGVDCSTRKETPVPSPPEVATTDPLPILCGERQCLNGGRCERGSCVCQMGYALPDCSLCLPHLHPRKCLDHCPLECKHGDCLTVHQSCHCTVGYMGEDCNLCIPAKAYLNCTNYCSPMCVNGATCNAGTQKCECTPGWTGEACHQPCPRGMFGLNCLQHCQCSAGSCDPVTGRCLCGPDSPSSPDCSRPCRCLVNGVCYSEAKCPTGTPNRLPPAVQTALPLTTAAGNLQDKKLPSSGEQKPMMMLVIATAIGAAVLLVVVVILIVCLVRSRRETARKPGQSEEAERVPMTDACAGNVYDDASSMPLPTAQPPSAPYRPTSGYEDVTDLHQNVPDLLQKHTEQSDISPYATTGNVTVHAESTPSEYCYVSVDELKVLKEEGTGDSYNRLDFLPRETSIRRPAADGLYSSLQDDGSYEDASSHLITNPLAVDLQDANNSSGYAKMSPSLNNRKASSLKHPKEDLRSQIQQKSASLQLPGKEVAGTSHGAKQPYENAYVGFDPKKSPKNSKPRMDGPPPPPPGQKPQTSASSGKKTKGEEIPHYAKPNKRKSQQTDQQEVPHYAKPNKGKSDIPEYAKPNKASSSGDHHVGGPANSNDQVERPPHGGDEEKSVPGSKPAAGYAHLMDAVSPTPNTNISKI